jgi:hypothetical protein
MESVKKMEMDNKLKGAEADKINLGLEIIRKERKAEEQAKRFKEIFPCCKPTIYSLWPPKEDSEADEVSDDRTASIETMEESTP